MSSRSAQEGTSSGVADQSKTWEVRLSASPAECLAAFAKTFNGGGGIGRPAIDWDVRTGHDKAVATYRKRRSVTTGNTEQRAEAAAMGSEVQFEAKPDPTGTTACTMWMSTRGTIIGITADAPAIRAYMQKVGRELKKLDKGANVAKR